MRICKTARQTKFLKPTLMSALVIAAFSSATILPAHASKPTQAEQAELGKYPSYTGYIEVIASNEGNGLAQLLAENENKTVFIETTVLRYRPMPKLKKTDSQTFTDRFENPVFEKCWGEEANSDGHIESGDEGFPLPLDQADIEAGCGTRIKIELARGDYGDNVDRAAGIDKIETYFIGFFEIKKQTLENGKALYRLTQIEVPEVTAQAFHTHATKKDRAMRKLSIEDNPANAKTK